MERLYRLLAWIPAPLFLLWSLRQGRGEQPLATRLRERLGRLHPSSAQRDGLWLHAASMGEVRAAISLIRALRLRFPTLPLWLSTHTAVGRAQAVDALGDDPTIRLFYFPLDLAPVMERLLSRLAPRAVILMERELWPTLLRCCRRRRIPVILANARLSRRSARRYRRWMPGVARRMAAGLARIAAQSEEDARRLIALGAAPERVAVVGNLKFDLALPDDIAEQGAQLRRALGVDRPVWIAASAREGEERPILEAHAALLRSVPNALLLLVPRHPQRFDAAARQIGAYPFVYARRSADEPCGAQTAVFLGDTMGELLRYYAAADVAFVGGTLLPYGGQNMVEPAALARPVLFGPHRRNFARIGRLLLERGAAREVCDADELAAALIELLQDPEQRRQMGARGQALVAENRGAAERMAGVVEEELGEHRKRRR